MEPDTDNHEAEDKGSPTLLDSLRQRRRAIADTTTTDMDVPGFDGQLVARYRLLTVDELGAIGKRVRKLPEVRQRVAASADVLAAACEGFYIRREPEDELVPLDPSGEVVRYDDRLGELLGYPAATAREAVIGLFGGHELKAIAHADELGAWFRESGTEVDTEFLGESRGTPR